MESYNWPWTGFGPLRDSFVDSFAGRLCEASGDA
jgi:hypothetical protein